MTRAVDPTAVARAALGGVVRTAGVVRRTPLRYDPYLPGRTVEVVRGFAIVGRGERRSWAAIVKRTEGPGLRAARRELQAYRLGIAAAAPATGLRAPRLLDWEENADSVALWLEPLRDEHGGRWTPQRFGVAASHIAAANVRASRLEIPAEFDSEDAWAERHGQPERLEEALARLSAVRRTPSSAQLAGLVADPGFLRTEALIASTIRRLQHLAAFRPTLLHHDLVRSNLFAIAPDGTAAIDWENVGRGPLGVDLAPLVIGSVRRGEASAADLPAIERLVLERYIGGLQAAGAGPGVEGAVRRAYRLALGLRWHVVLGAFEAWLDPGSSGMRGSRRDEPRSDALRHLIELTRHILDTADAEPL